MRSTKLLPFETFYVYSILYLLSIQMCQVAAKLEAPAIHVHLMNYSHRNLMHTVATHVKYNTIITNFINDDMIVLRAAV